ncbi:MAG: hypothetical protein H3Z49_03315 [archaeon]|nr:hypothetical protein [archaeon]
MIITDPPKLEVGKTFGRIAHELGACVTIILLRDITERSIKPIKEIDNITLAAIRASDMVLLLITEMPEELEFREQIIEEAKRNSKLGCILKEDFAFVKFRTDCKDIVERTKVLTEILTKAKKVIIKTEYDKSHSLEMNLGGWSRTAGSDASLRGKRTFNDQQAGEAFIIPTEGTSNGEICIDLTMSQIGALSEPIILKVRKGKVIEIRGGREAEELKKLLKKGEALSDQRGIPPANNYLIAELGIGTNSKAKILGMAAEDEKILGTVHIALGNNTFLGGSINTPYHIDGVTKRPTLIIDGETIIENGKMKPIEVLRNLFQHNYMDFFKEAQDLSSFSHIRKISEIGKVKRNDQKELLYRLWEDVHEGRKHETRVGDSATAELASKIWKRIPEGYSISIRELAKELEAEDKVKMVLCVMKTYELIDIKRTK